MATKEDAVEIFKVFVRKGNKFNDVKMTLTMPMAKMILEYIEELEEKQKRFDAVFNIINKG